MATKKFEVRDGFTFGARNEYVAGDVLELDESAGVAFPDKLKPVSESRKAENKSEGKDKDPEQVPELAYLTEGQRKSLATAGFAKQADLDKATDEQLLAVDGVKDVTVRTIRTNKGK